MSEFHGLLCLLQVDCNNVVFIPIIIKLNSKTWFCIDTYDVQSVSGTAIAGGLELTCTFAEGSQAQHCILIIYRTLENGVGTFIANIIILGRNAYQTLNLENMLSDKWLKLRVMDK